MKGVAEDEVAEAHSELRGDSDAEVPGTGTGRVGSLPAYRVGDGSYLVVDRSRTDGLGGDEQAAAG